MPTHSHVVTSGPDAPKHALKDTLERIIGAVIVSVEHTPLRTIGYTAASHERLELTLASGERRSFVTKQVDPSRDWVARRSADAQGREAMLLREAALAGVWDAFECPYRGVTADASTFTLVMDDLTPHLFPDVREPIDEQREDALLESIAALHARFWQSPALALPWLARPEQYATLLVPGCTVTESGEECLPPGLRSSVERGWAVAIERLPDDVRTLMLAPAAELAWLWTGLPRTLLHGDVKIANLVVLPNGRVAAFDWALLGEGPSTIDLGWYLAVNATRLARPKHVVIDRYRAHLEVRLETPISESTWSRMLQVGLVIGARMLLWSKGLALADGRPGAEQEWAWWVEHLLPASARA